MPTALDAVYRKELHLVRSRSATPAYFRTAIELLPVLVLPEVTTLPLERFLEGVELYRRGEALKVVFAPGGRRGCTRPATCASRTSRVRSRGRATCSCRSRSRSPTAPT